MSLDLSLTESEEILNSTVQNFLQREVPKETLQSLLDSDTGYTEEIWKKAVDMGWLGILIPEEYGGTGYPFTTAGVLFEALGSAPLPGPYFSSGVLGSLILMESGNEEQKKSLLPDVANGKIVLAPAITEDDYRWTAGAINTLAEEKNGDYVLNGLKLFTPDAQAASHFIVVARTGSGDGEGGGISLFLVERESDGVTIRRLPGFLAGRSFEVKLDSVAVPRSNLLGEVNGGWPALERAISQSIPVLCAYQVGGCQAAFDMTLDYSRVRIQFGQPVGRFQRVQDMIIEMANHTDAARLTTYEALWKLDSGKPDSECVHLAKAVTSEAYWQVCTLGHRAISGISYSSEHPLSFHTRTSRFLYNYLGEPDFHRQQLAGILVNG
jgi:alkylation response protein AidB-like acyl-CoA dehydrogenase